MVDVSVKGTTGIGAQIKRLLQEQQQAQNFFDQTTQAAWDAKTTADKIALTRTVIHGLAKERLDSIAEKLAILQEELEARREASASEVEVNI